MNGLDSTPRSLAPNHRWHACMRELVCVFRLDHALLAVAERSALPALSRARHDAAPATAARLYIAMRACLS